ncbi:MAG: adenylate/guanylate cyclase domain-containing protein [Dehalococcoidia bacterium]
MTAAAPPALLEGAVVFTDIVGFTEYTALQGDEQALALLAVQDGFVADSLPADGRVVKEIGDGLMLWLPDACAALLTGLLLSQRFEEWSDEAMIPLGLRVGMNYGQFMRRGDDLVGHCVNVASRIVNVAGPGEVLVSETVVGRVNDQLEGVLFDELGPVVMKGVPEPVRLFRAHR